MKGELSNELGEVLIDMEVLREYAGYAAMETLGVVGLAMINVKDGAYKIIRKENASQGVSASLNDNHVRIKLHIIVAYGVNIRAVCQNVVDNVKSRVELNTGLKVDHISVMVDGVKNIDN